MEKLLPIACCRPLGAPTLSDAEAHAAATLFKALADPARVKIVNLLAGSDEPVCACEFEPALGLSQGTVSHHLKRLTEAGRSEEHTSELQSRFDLVCRLLLEKKKKKL